MKTFCDLGAKLSEAADYINNLPSDYKFTIKVKKYGVLIEGEYDIYGMTLSIRKGLTWRQLNEIASIRDVIVRICENLEETAVITKEHNKLRESRFNDE